MSYTLNPSIPDPTNLGTVSLGVAVGAVSGMCKDGSDVTHFFGAFGGLYDTYYIHYVNLSTEAHHLYSCPDGTPWKWVYVPSADKVCCATNYEGSLTEWDLSASPPTQTVIYTGIGSNTDFIVGDDNRVYYLDCASGSYKRVYSYNPAVGLASKKTYDDITTNNSAQYGNLGADADYVYAGVGNNNDRDASSQWTLVIADNTGTTWIEWNVTGYGTDKIVGVFKATNGNWYAHRLTISDVDEYYLLSGGTYELIDPTGLVESSKTASPKYMISAGPNDWPDFSSYYGYTFDSSDFYPVKTVHEWSTVNITKDSNQQLIQTTESFSSGPWVAQGIKCMWPMTGTTLLALSEAYNAGVEIDYLATPPTTYINYEGISPYTLAKHPTSGDYYLGGYANRVLRLTNFPPESNWNWGSNNPYNIAPLSPLLHYRYCIDFDANGLVWIGGNTTRLGDNYGGVTWYNPSNEATDTLFSATWSSAPITRFTYLCSCLNRTKILVSDDNFNIYKVDAATKIVDTSIGPLTANRNYMIEVSNDYVFVLGKYGSSGATSNFGILQPSTMTWLYGPVATGESGIAFGYGDDEWSRMGRRLIIGPDGYVWMYFGNVICRIDPNTLPLSIENIKTTSFGYGKLTFSPNNLDLMIYCLNAVSTADTAFYYIRRILIGYSVEYSKGAYSSLPADDTDLSEIYTSAQREDVALDDEIRVGESGTGYILHEFKEVAGPYDTKVDLHCNLQAPLAPADYPVYLQCYDRVTVGGMWVTVATDNASSANTDFDMDFQLNSGTTPTFANCKDESGVISSRVYQTNVPLS